MKYETDGKVEIATLLPFDLRHSTFNLRRSTYLRVGVEHNRHDQHQHVFVVDLL